jgi:hypothetical protein
MNGRQWRQVVLAAVLGLAPVVPALAGDGAPAGGPDGRRGDPMARLAETLSLDDAQAARVREILDEQRDAMRALRDKQGGGAEADRGAARTEMAAIQAATREKLAGVLSAEQMEKYDGMRREMRGRGGPGGPGGPGPGRRGDRRPPQGEAPADAGA